MSRILALILNGFMVGVESYALSRYYLTRNHLIAGNASPWVTPATLWPTFLLLGMSVVTFLLNIITICAYACGVGASNKINSCTTVINYIFLGVQVVLWGITVGLFKMANNGNDLWGYSCSDQADQIQAEVRSFLDFGKLCTMQVSFFGFFTLARLTNSRVLRGRSRLFKPSRISSPLSPSS